MKQVIAALLLVLCTMAISPAHALSEQEETIEKARTAAESMFSDANYPLLLELTMKAKAVLIVPNMVRVGFFIGGRGGNAVLLTRRVDDQGNVQWSAPAFYTIGGISYGLQIGAQSSQLIIAIMTDKGVQAVMNNKVTLGADAGLALGDIGAGAQASTGMDIKADMYAFAKSSGAFVGIALDGTVIQPRVSYNEGFYGAGATPRSILIDRTTTDPRAQSLIDVMPR
jgi:lipid-binding SYLF domain-containing protein